MNAGWERDVILSWMKAAVSGARIDVLKS